VGQISIKAKMPPEPNATIIAEVVATTFVLQDAASAKAGSGQVVPKQPMAGK
jgi:hypothetical protein